MIMIRFKFSALAALSLLLFSPVPSRAQPVDVGVAVPDDYDTGGFCDAAGCPDSFWDYPVAWCPVYFDGDWYQGPTYYRVFDDEPYFWVDGDWHLDEWDGPRPGWACADAYGPPLGYDWYEDNGFVWPVHFLHRYFNEHRGFYQGHDFDWWRHHHRSWDRDHHFDKWRDQHLKSWFATHRFDHGWQGEKAGRFAATSGPDHFRSAFGRGSVGFALERAGATHSTEVIRGGDSGWFHHGHVFKEKSASFSPHGTFTSFGSRTSHDFVRPASTGSRFGDSFSMPSRFGEEGNHFGDGVRFGGQASAHSAGGGHPAGHAVGHGFSHR